MLFSIDESSRTRSSSVLSDEFVTSRPPPTPVKRSLAPASILFVSFRLVSTVPSFALTPLRSSRISCTMHPGSKAIAANTPTATTTRRM